MGLGGGGEVCTMLATHSRARRLVRSSFADGEAARPGRVGIIRHASKADLQPWTFVQGRRMMVDCGDEEWGRGA
jgi:hypothetical protein